MTAPRPKRLQARDRAVAQQRATTRTSKGGHGHRIPQAVDEVLQARAGYRCELCGEAIRRRCQRHHRKLRSQGGLDDPTNLVILHPGCHNTIHLNPVWAKENGWIVPAGSSPARTPIRLHDIRRVFLTAAGDYREVAA